MIVNVCSNDMFFWYLGNCRTLPKSLRKGKKRKPNGDLLEIPKPEDIVTFCTNACKLLESSVCVKRYFILTVFVILAVCLMDEKMLGLQPSADRPIQVQLKLVFSSYRFI